MDSNTQVPMQFTHFSLRDGDNNTMLGRVALHITHEARKPKFGDMIKLHLFTELTYTIGDSGPMPGVEFFITQGLGMIHCRLR